MSGSELGSEMINIIYKIQSSLARFLNFVAGQVRTEIVCVV